MTCRQRRFWLSFGAVAALWLQRVPVEAQEPQTLTIARAVEIATRDQPSVAEARARAQASTEAVSEARSAYLPRLDALWQANRASRNNVFGLLLPQSVVPQISGPVLGTDGWDSVWGSAAGLLFSVEIFDFGRRADGMHAARAQASSAAASVEASKLSTAVAAADAFLGTLGAEQSASAARANVARLEVLARAIKAQVDAEIKPGADLSRIDAELAVARNRVIGAEEDVTLARLRLAAALGAPDDGATLDRTTLLQRQPGDAVGPGLSAAPPGVRAAEESARAAEAARNANGTQFRPKIQFQSAIAARGSGARVDGTSAGGAHGLWPNVPNWAAGVTVSFSVLDSAGIRAHTRVQTELLAAAQARAEMTRQQARTDMHAAEAMIDAARRIVANVPIQLATARSADAQARARYDAGLTGLTEVADAQRLLAQAESDAALAALALWRAHLAEAAAIGDLTPFLAEASAPTGPALGF
jgi:outer membrane protein TolC